MMWLERILAAEERQKNGEVPFTQDDRLAAQSWFTCAVGEQVARGVALQVEWFDTAAIDQPYKRADDGLIPYPLDLEIRQAGLEFVDAVWSQNPSKAEECLAKVEGRALQLKREAHEP